MSRRPFLLDGMQPALQLLLLFCFTVIFGLAFTLSAMYLVRPLFDVTNIDTLMKAAIETPNAVALNANQTNALKFLQFMASLGSFLIPAMLFGWIKFPGGDFLKLNSRLPIIILVLGILILVTSSPFIDFIYSINRELKLPSVFSGVEKMMDDAEHNDSQIMILFMQTPRKYDLWINLIVMAIIPALGEELIFRGCLQQILKERIRSIHAAIWITAFIFSFIHFQFYGFFPRLLLGALLGYLFYWSGSLWVPIAAHAFNNGIQVLLAYLHDHNMITFDVTSDAALPASLTIIASAVCAVLLWYAWRTFNRRQFIF